MGLVEDRFLCRWTYRGLPEMIVKSVFGSEQLTPDTAQDVSDGRFNTSLRNGATKSAR